MKKIIKKLAATVTVVMVGVLICTTSAQPVSAAANGKIVFMANDGEATNVGTVNPDGSGYQLLTSDGTSLYPTITPNGQKIIYGSNFGEGSWPLYSMNVDGSAKTNIGINGFYGAAVTNNKISYLNIDNFMFNIANIDGTNAVSTGYAPELEGMLATPAWTSNGGQMVYPQGDEDGVSLFVANADGSNSQQISSLPYAAIPTISPDDSKVYFLGSQDGESTSVYSVNIDGSNQAELFSAPNFGLLAISPDGSKLFLVPEAEQQMVSLYTTTLEDGQFNKIIEVEDGEGIGSQGFGWSPDSQKILFLDRDDEGQSDIFTINSDGSGITNVTNTPDIFEFIFSGQQSWGAATSNTGSNSATLQNPQTNQPILLQTPEGTSLTCSSTLKESSNTTQDNSYNYPLGLVNFCFDTENQNNEVSLTFVTSLKSNQVTPRKYNSTSQTYFDIPGAQVTETTYQDQPALKLTYTITDNGQLDLDPVTGQIKDPVGLAVAADGSLASTGTNTAPLITLAALLVLGSGLYLKRRHS